MNSNNISAAEFIERISNGEKLNLLDVREPIEYHSFNLGGENIPLGKLPDALPLDDIDTDDEIIMICKAGLRSGTAQSILQQNGYTNVRNLTGGLLAVQKLKQ
ncbi:rhodanese-like domain-containing protein [Mucilaginibacter myungsuensis]|uniref:Rhodanese-like domain-containing protein n=1 Tax=Mucilaginibacter myungsuensis TaxID=649104 RepID=A0A929L406_9SPHI|nr:rhodanese-like domain-containing protein [Mucilaginibacter myungsuensis]MBE9663615.1 rhodanese-like domain-containing protein [Mucilaginibacter myungsuensis]MDN3599061.1 rhodanese-like domain-containing protein [Mucilaginibacter myungsuensis]